ncbi:MAG: hypothetical protein RLZZ502_844, partial [Pseudomonadota bacterium]
CVVIIHFVCRTQNIQEKHEAEAEKCG